MTRSFEHCATLLLSISLAICPAAQSANPPLTNNDVQVMLSQGLSDDVVVEAISANEVNFDVSPTGLLALKKANVSDKVVQAMLAAESEKRKARAQQISAAAAQQSPRTGVSQGYAMFNPNIPMPNQPAVAAEAQMPKITLIVGDRRQPMNPSGTEIASGKGKGGSAAGSVLKGFGKTVLVATNMAGVPIPHGGGRGGMGVPNVARTWALPGRSSPFTIAHASPQFEIEFDDIPGVDPDSYEPVLLKLVQTKDNWRLVSTSKDKFDKHGNDTRSDKIKLEDKIPLSVNPLGRGHLIVAPSAELPPGEYGLLLHPKKSEKEYAGTANVNGDAIFYSVWDFSLNPAPMASAGKN
jgi:hypothetical protein